MCGILGIVSQKQIVQDIYDGLTVLQHRGQDAAGIATFDGYKKCIVKGKGFVRDVIKQKDVIHLRGNIGMGHVRYPTAGNHDNVDEAQPFYVNSPFGITLIHNGNLINDTELKKDLFDQDLRHLSTDSDSEVIINILAHELALLGKKSLEPDDIFKAVESLHNRCKGSYSCISYIFGHGMLVFRDPFAIRPLCYGERIGDDGKKEYIFASESVAIYSLGFNFVGDIGPGEAIYVNLKGEIFSKVCHKNPILSPCIFEYIYLARPDSIIDKISVYKARLRLGESLGKKILVEGKDLHIDVVMPIPDTSMTTAVQVARTMNLPYREGFIKNRYIGRTFIMPGQQVRKKSVRQKLSPIEIEFRDKNVLLIDDSIVRGNTSLEIIKMARQAGARKVYFASAAPKIKYPNVYGIDIPTRKELIANTGGSTKDIAKEIGADFLFFQDLEGIGKVVSGEQDVEHFDKSCFDGVYCTGGVTEEYLEQIEAKRGKIS